MKKRFLIVILFLVLLVLIFTFITKNNKKDNITTGDEDTLLSSDELAELIGEKVDKTYGTEKEKRYGYNLDNYDMAASVIYEFVEYINNNDFENALEMIADNYLIEKNYTIETLKKDFDFSNKEKGMITKAFEDYGHKFIMLVDITDFELDESVGQDIPVDEPLSKTFTVYDDRKLIPEDDIQGPTLDLSKVENANEINIIGLDTLLSEHEIEINGIDSITTDLKLAISMIPVLSKDLSTKNDLEEYYLRNHDLLFDIYGLKTSREFIDFAKKIMDMDNISLVNLDLDSTKESGKIIDLDMSITSENTEKILNLRIVRERIVNTISYYVFIK